MVTTIDLPSPAYLLLRTVHETIVALCKEGDHAETGDFKAARMALLTTDRRTQ